MVTAHRPSLSEAREGHPMCLLLSMFTLSSVIMRQSEVSRGLVGDVR